MPPWILHSSVLQADHIKIVLLLQVHDTVTFAIHIWLAAVTSLPGMLLSDINASLFFIAAERNSICELEYGSDHIRIRAEA